MAQEFANTLHFKAVQRLYDKDEIYKDNEKKWLKRCVFCLAVINPFEVGYHLQCCKTAYMHETCRIGLMRLSRHQNLGTISRRAGKNLFRRKLNINNEHRCPMCRKSNAVIVKFTDHQQYMDHITVKCPVPNCERLMTSVDLLKHYSTCAEDPWTCSDDDGRTDNNAQRPNEPNETPDEEERQPYPDMEIVDLTHELTEEENAATDSEDEEVAPVQHEDEERVQAVQHELEYQDHSAESLDDRLMRIIHLCRDGNDPVFDDDDDERLAFDIQRE